MKILTISSQPAILGYTKEIFIKLAIEDDLHKADLDFKVDIKVSKS